jgi:hypothetical protein
MPNIDEILKVVGFVDWTDEEQSALSKMMYNFANGRANHHVIGKTDRVLTTFIKILDTHLPEKED